MKFTNNRIAQVTLVGLLMVFFGLVVLSIMMPSILLQVSYMAANLTAYGYTGEALLAKLIPLAMLITFIASIIIYGQPQQ